MGEGVLYGIKVLELGGGISGPFCARLLADYGADVVKIEEPAQGDRARHMGPFVRNDPHPDKSIPFLYLNTNKRSITLDFTTPLGRQLLLKLVSWADILVENFPPRFLPELGLSYKVLSEVNPRLIVTSISSFGQTGPYRDFQACDIVTCAMSGLMYLSGDDDMEPLRNALSQSHYVAGSNGAFASLVALYQRLAIGEGQHVDVSITECLASHLVQAVSAYALMGAVLGRRSPHHSGLEEIMPCQDGYCLPSAQGSQPWETVSELMGIEELKDPKFATSEGRITHGKDLHDLLVQGLSRWKKKELFHASAERRLLFGMVQDAEELFHCPQLRSRGFFEEVDHPVAGKGEYPGEMVRFSDGSFQARYPAPLLGQHNPQVYCELLGYSRRDLVRLRQLGVI